jgi:hypothetical protein
LASGHRELKQRIEAEIAHLMILEGKLGPDTGGHRGSSRPNGTSDYDLAWFGIAWGAALDEALQGIGIRLVDRWQNVREAE